MSGEHVAAIGTTQPPSVYVRLEALSTLSRRMLEWDPFDGQNNGRTPRTRDHYIGALQDEQEAIERFERLDLF